MNAYRARGIALLTALLVVALVTVAAVAMVSRQQLDIHRTGNVLDADRAWQVALGVEAWAIGQLVRDERATDHLDEDWAKPLPLTQIDGGGTVTGSIADLQGRFNVNNLMDANQPDAPEDPTSDSPTPVNLDKLRATNLANVLELDERLVSALIDWVDADLNPQPFAGAEDSLYAGRSPAYRTANGPMVSVTELRLLEPMDDNSYQALKGHLAALPEELPININTASAALLRAIVPGLSEFEAEGLVEQRLAAPFESVDAFVGHGLVAGRKISAKGLSVRSAYFLVTGLARAGRAQVRLTSVLYRDEDNRVQVLHRSRGGF